MNIYSISSYTSSLIYLYLGFYAMKSDIKKTLNVRFFICCISFFIWSFSYTFIYSTNNIETAWFWYKISSIGWCTLPSSIILLFISFNEANNYSIKKRWYLLFLYIPSLIFIYKVYTSILMTSGFLITDKNVIEIQANSSIEYIIFNFYYLGGAISTLIYLALWGINSSEKRKKKQTVIIILSGMTSLLLGLVFNTILPSYRYNIPSVAPINNLIYALGLWVALIKYGLLEITPQIVAEEIISQIQDIVIILDSEKRIVKTNKQAEKTFGYTSPVFKHLAIDDFFEDINFVNNHLNNIKMWHKNISNIECNCISKGNLIPVSISSSGVVDKNKDIIGLVLIIKDLRLSKQLTLQKEELTTQKNIIETLKYELHETKYELQTLHNQLESQNILLEKNDVTLHSIHTILHNKSSKFKNILNHINQGLFIINDDLLIDKEYSSRCNEIFKKDISGQYFPDLFYPNNAEQRKYLEELATSIFNSNKIQSEIYLTLLPEQINIHNQVYEIIYKKIEDHNISTIIIAILTDVTDKITLEYKRKNEQIISKTAISILTNIDCFMELIKDYKEFIKTTFKTINNENYKSILRKIQIFKVDFNQFNMTYVVNKLDKLESILCSNDNISNYHNINQQDLLDCLENELQNIKSYLNIDILNYKNIVSIDYDLFHKLKNEITNVSSSNQEDILKYFQKLKYKSLKQVLSHYSKYLKKLVAPLDKSIKSFEIQGDDIYVNINLYKEFIYSLVHIFKNCIDHGIEPEGVRLSLSKSYEGNINCSIKISNGIVTIIIKDDGRGIDCPKIIDKALSKGLLTNEQIKNTSRKDIYNLIFNEHFSTNDSPNLLSCHGLGLYQVKQCVTKLNGTIDVESITGKGSTFIIKLPVSKDMLII